MINENIIKFIKICEELGLKEKIEDLNRDFKLRLKFQKIFYFLVKLGFPIKLQYNFYKYGPYSPDLAEIYYESMELSKENHKQYINKIEFTKEEKEKIETLKKISNAWGNDIEKLEYYSSVLYIYDDMYFKDWSKELVQDKILELKPELFNKFNFENVLKELKKFNLIHNHD
ncbi:MAG: hypothetical protein ACTSRH_15620 [Promethearchaeota archaeon]